MKYIAIGRVLPETNIWSASCACEETTIGGEAHPWPEIGVCPLQQGFGTPSIPYQNSAPGSVPITMIEGESAGGRQELRHIPLVTKMVWSRKFLDLRRCGIRGEPDFPDGDGRWIGSCEPDGFSVSPDEVVEPNGILEPTGILERMGMREYAGGNVANEDFTVFGVTINSNHLSVRRVRHAGSINIGLCWYLPSDDAGNTTRLEVPANDD